ncbi:hypothetical protein Sru01_41790 [Sphaerisporangium rufum]|uniref:DUF397 domain-containing protein n=1 Tax=Sphaerisporangium rufum TaxID=1381558 RepID=A0A919V206_9ACTN|nr:DUF397 domain-containing protein [Sphaerisporangium rufum]GII79197.1 hypothetical protein Sru01_41790 [Sphaerisporangium rufum]
MNVTENRDELDRNLVARIPWHISTMSDNGGGSCVEAGPLPDGSGRVALRHSHHPDGPIILYTRTEWHAFISGIKLGEFDFAAP